ncbi:MAG: pilus assembly protein PilM [Kiritimatiellia bacterium]
MGRLLVSGILLRSEALEWTVLRSTRDKLTVVDSGSVPIERSAEPAPDRTSEPADAPDIVRTIQGLRTRFRGEVTLGVPSEQVLIWVVTLPKATAEELQSMVSLQVEKFSPFPPETMVFSHEVIGEKDDSNLMLIAAVREETVNSLVEQVATVGIVPERLDAATLGWWRLLGDQGQIPAAGRHILLLLDKAAPEIIVIEEGRPISFRTLLGTEKLGAVELVEEIASEIALTLMAVELEYGASPPESIRIWCRGNPPATLSSSLAERFGCEAKTASLDSLPGLTEGLARRHATATGFLVDLTPARWSAKRAGHLLKSRVLKAAAAALGVWFVAVAGFVGAFAWHRHTLARLQKEQQLWKEPASEVREMRNRAMLIGRYLDRKQSPLECLREVVLLQPPGVELTSFLYKKGETVKIAGAGDSVGLVYDFKKKLDGSDLFREAKLQGPRRDVQRRKEIFDLDLKLPASEG